MNVDPKSRSLKLEPSGSAFQLVCELTFTINGTYEGSEYSQIALDMAIAYLYISVVRPCRFAPDVVGKVSQSRGQRCCTHMFAVFL